MAALIVVSVSFMICILGPAMRNLSKRTLSLSLVALAVALLSSCRPEPRLALEEAILESQAIIEELM